MKKILLSLLLLFSSVISFGFCSISQTNINNYNLQYVSTLTWSDMNSTNFSYIMPDSNTYCLSIDNGIVIGSSNLQISSAYCNNNVCTTQGTLNNFNGYRFFNTSTNITFYNNILKLVPSTTTTELSNLYLDNFICYTPYSGYLSNATYTFMNTAYLRGVSSSNSPNLSVSVYKVNNSCSCPTCPTCPTCDYSSYENQISVLSGDLLTCQNSVSSCNNNLGLCGSSLNSCYSELGQCMNGSVSTGDIQWSALYINNIQHLGKPIITIDIPEEISWDYVSTGDSFNLDINGYNVDSDYIEGIINLQNTTPTNEDFNKLVSEVVPLLVPGLFIIAFLYFVFRFIKKVF